MSAGRLFDAIRGQAARGASRVAVVDGERRATYAQLVEGAWRLARLLAAHGIAKGDRVALLMTKSSDAIVAMLGCAEAGVLYVPLDTSSPAARLAKVVQAAEPKLALISPETKRTWLQLVALLPQPLRPEAAAITDLPIPEVPCAFTGADLAGVTPAEPSAHVSSGDALHILFTSGSTGTPKGVVITHANVQAFLEWALPHFGVREDDRCSSHPPLHFDLSTFDVYGTLASGAELHLVGEGQSLLPHKLAEWIRSSRLTQWFSVPSILSYLAKFDVVRQRDFPDLRRVIWCGEVLPTPVLIEWMQRVPHARFTNLYGPTEATIASTYWDLSAIPSDQRALIPIGRACAGERALVLDEALLPVPTGEIGEICLAGAGLSPGYWRDPDKTALAFVEDPSTPGRRLYRTGDLGRLDAQGVLLFAGRKDTQIKCRGYRVELGEIEAALHTFAFLGESAVVALPSDGFEGSTICCAYVGSEGMSVPAGNVRKELARLVPSYMLPSRWFATDALPRNQNGKVDRQALHRLFADQVGCR